MPKVIPLKLLILQKVHEDHLRLVKGGPFKLNLYPREYFDINPYFDDKPLAPAKKPTPEKPVAHPFKPSSPAKKVSLLSLSTVAKSENQNIWWCSCRKFKSYCIEDKYRRRVGLEET